MKRKLAAVVMTLVLLLGLPFRAFAQETTQPTQTAQTTETQPEETQPEETQPIEIRETISISIAEDLVALGENCSLDTWSLVSGWFWRRIFPSEGWTSSPLATFGGIFEGNGHVISDLNLTGDFAPAGLFGIVQSTGRIRNLTVEGTVEPGERAATPAASQAKTTAVWKTAPSPAPLPANAIPAASPAAITAP